MRMMKLKQEKTQMITLYKNKKTLARSGVIIKNFQCKIKLEK